MIKKIIDLLFKKKEVEQEKIRIKDIKNISEELLKKYVDINIIPSFENICEEIKNIEIETEQKCIELEQSKLKNENISIKEKQYMDGNRKSYVKHVRILLKSLPKLPSYELIEETYPQFKEVIENFAKHTMRARQILHHFFEHETEAIHNSIASINKQFENMRKLVQEEKYKKYLSLLKAISRYDNAVQGKKELKQEIKNNEDIILKTKNELEQFTRKLEDQKKSKEYYQLEKLKKQKLEEETKLNEIITDINTKFAKFERALRKYERIAIDESAWVRAYQKDPYQAASVDSENKGTKVLEGLKNKINNNSIELKNNEKIIANLDEMINNNFINKIHTEIKSTKSNLEKIKKELRTITIADEIEKLNNKINSNKRIINDHERQLEELKQKFNDMPLDKYLEEIKEDLSNIKNKDIILE
jgi:hypothetical protein